MITVILMIMIMNLMIIHTDDYDNYDYRDDNWL